MEIVKFIVHGFYTLNSLSQYIWFYVFNFFFFPCKL